MRAWAISIWAGWKAGPVTSALLAPMLARMGHIELRGNQLATHLCFGNGSQICVATTGWGWSKASAFGTAGKPCEIRIDVNRFYHGGSCRQRPTTGRRADDINANNAEIYNASGLRQQRVGGTIDIDATACCCSAASSPGWAARARRSGSASLLAYGTTTAAVTSTRAAWSSPTWGMSSAIDAVIRSSTSRPAGRQWRLGHLNADDISIGDTFFANASGDGVGGNHRDPPTQSIWRGAGRTGATAVTVTTTTVGSLFVGSTAYVDTGPGWWHAPSVDIMSADDAVSGYGAMLTDEA